MYGLDKQFELILEEGLERRWARHRTMAEVTQRWARERFSLYADEQACSDTVTCIENNRGADVGDMIAKMKERGFLLSNGYGNLKGKAFRIAHMGERQVGENRCR